MHTSYIPVLNFHDISCSSSHGNTFTDPHVPTLKITKDGFAQVLPKDKREVRKNRGAHLVLGVVDRRSLYIYISFGNLTVCY